MTDKDRFVADEDSLVLVVEESPKSLKILKGGPGSGHHGHSGLKGVHGGSAPRGGSSSSRQAIVKDFEKLKQTKLKTWSEDEAQSIEIFSEDLYTNSRSQQRADEYLQSIGIESDSLSLGLNLFHYEDPESGIRSELDDINYYSSRDALTFEGNLLAPNGAKIGRFSRSITSEDGSAILELNSLQLDGDYQGKGFGRKFYRHVEETAVSAGISSITLNANMTVGGYAWARMGYDYKDRSSATSMALRLHTAWKNSVDFNESMTEDMYFSFQVMPPWQMAALTASDGARIGKRTLLGRAWGGVKRLDPSNEGYIAGQLYMRGES